MFAIMRRELSAYFTSPIGYIYLGVFYAYSGYYFFGSSLLMNTADLAGVFSSILSLILFLIPILTMRLFSEDKKHKTDQLLLTAPVSLISLIAGKLLAALAVFTAGISITLVYGLVAAFYTAPGWAEILGNFVAVFLIGAALIAIGMFISALTESQVIAAVGGFAVAMGFLMIEPIASIIKTDWLKKLIEKLSFFGRYSDFTAGIFDFTGIFFFLSICIFFSYLTMRILEKRRWS